MKLLAVDGNNLLMRALHATKRAGLTAHGVPTGPLLAFVNSLAKHIREEDPTHVGVAWDGGGRGMRHEADGEYKANRLASPDDEHELRESSFALAKEFCVLTGIHQASAHGVEADDIIGAWWCSWVTQRMITRDLAEFVILSSDKDLLQLVDRPGVEQVRLSSANTPTDRWDARRVAEHYGVPPSAVPALLAIAGDSSDNIKGVYGIGPKKAAKALREHDLDFEKTIITKWPDEVEHLRTNFQLTNLRGEWSHGASSPALPPETSITGTGDPRFDDRYEPLIEFLDRYELDSVKTKLLVRQLWTERGPERGLGRPLRPPVA